MRLPSSFQRFDTTNLRLRLISASIMAPGALLAVYLGSIFFGIAVACAVVLGLYEWLRLAAPDTKAQTAGIACAFMGVLIAGAVLFTPFVGAVLAAFFTFLLFLIALRDRNENAGWVAFGIPYMAGSGLALLALRGIPGHGMDLLFYLFATVWGMDIGGFIAGNLIGGPKLAPSISPSKTWAGLFGGIALSLICGYATADWLGARLPTMTLILSPLLALAAQAGDLFESYFKRRAGVKESGDLIPGHGGVLDRIDGLVFAGIFAYLFQAAFGESVHWW